MSCVSVSIYQAAEKTPTAQSDVRKISLSLATFGIHCIVLHCEAIVIVVIQNQSFIKGLTVGTGGVH